MMENNNHTQSPEPNNRLPNLRHLIINLIIGTFIIIWAIKEQWSASQIIWQFWISSLLFGILFFIMAVIIQLRNEKQVWTEWKKIKRKTLFITTAAMLLGIIFFVPVLFFHSLYALFLNHLFPILDWDPMGKHISMSVVFVQEIIVKCVSMYWIFLLGMFFSKVNDLIRFNRTGKAHILMDPFKSVIQMHILILLFGLFSALKLSSNVLYLVLILGFLQITDLIQWIKDRNSEKKPV